LSPSGQIVSSSFPDKNVDGSFPSNEIDPDIVDITLERKIYRGLSDLEVRDPDFLKKVREKRGRKLDCRVMGLNGESKTGL
jgi:hypothetical protein